jgi:sugar phosphate isomerase/epimerase
MLPKYHAFFEPCEFIDLLGRYPNLTLALDTGHANMGEGGSAKILEFIGQLGDRIGHVHVSDNMGLKDDHLPIGGGTIDFPEVVNAIKQTGYDDTVTLEVFVEDRRQLQVSRRVFAALFEDA